MQRLSSVARLAFCLVLALLCIAAKRGTPSGPPVPDIGAHTKLPAPAVGVVVGKSGQYLFLELAKIREIAVFDVAAGKVIKYLPTKSDDYVMAASASKLFIAYKDLHTIQRFDLGKLEAEFEITAPAGGVSKLAAASGADGPVFLVGDTASKTHFALDPVTLHATRVPSRHWGGAGGGAWGPAYVHVSFDGSTLVASGGGWAGAEVHPVAALDTMDVGGMPFGGETFISGDGQLLFPQGSRAPLTGSVMRNDVKTPVQGIEGSPFPADCSSLSLAMRKDKTFYIFPNSDPRPILTIKEFADKGPPKMPLGEKIHLIPQFNVLVYLGHNGEEIITRKFNLADELAASGTDYFYVDSSPKTTARRGAAYSYQVSAKSKHGGVKYELNAGPKGMTVSSEGLVSWNVPNDFGDSKPSVILTVSDASGQSTFQTFFIDLAAGPLAPPPAVGLALIKAQWGAGDIWWDVTDKLKPYIVNNALHITPSGSLLGDPTPGTSKTLRITYYLDGAQKTATANQDIPFSIGDKVAAPQPAATVIAKQTAPAPPSTPPHQTRTSLPEKIPPTGLYIVKAEWGARKKLFDVTEKIRSYVKDNRLELRPSSGLLGDPAPAVPKSLRLTYAINGVQKTENFAEEAQISLASPGVVAGSALSSADEPMQFNLPESYSEYHPAAGGKLLAFHLPKARCIQIYETVSGKLKGTIKLSADTAIFAAGENMLVVGLPEQELLQSYSLKTFQRNKTAPLPFKHPLQLLHMGNASDGPVYAFDGSAVQALDGTTLEPLQLRGQFPRLGDRGDFKVSADGATVLASSPYSSEPFGIARVHNGIIFSSQAAQRFNYGYPRFNVSADGSAFFYTHTVLDSAGKTIDKGNDKFANYLPTSDPRFFIALKNANRNGSDFAICTLGDRRELVDIHDMGKLGDHGGTGDLASVGITNTKNGAEPRVLYIASENTVAALPVSNNEFVLRKLDLNAAFLANKNSASPDAVSFAVVSLPVANAVVGQTYSYQVEVLPTSGKFTFKVENAPAGLTVSPTGLVSWKPDNRPLGGVIKVILSVTDASGQDILHAFNINVTRVGPDARPTVGIVNADAHRIELPDEHYAYTPGRGGAMLILSGNELAVTAPDGFTIKEHHFLPKAYFAIAERPDYYVALCQEPRSIDILNKKTLEVIRSRAIAFPSLVSLSLNPTRPVSYVGYTQPGDFPASHFMIFDEKTAEARTDDNWVGAWVAASPDGKFLMTGFQETYQKGHEIIDNPDRIWIVPTYGSFDSLARYDLDAAGEPTGVAHKDGVGGGGIGIRLSADGKRIAYLSRTGYPSGSGNLGAWDPLDLSKLAIAYRAKGIASTTDLAFHPLLPLVAAAGKGTVAFFDRETGDTEDSLLNSDDLAGEDVQRVYFSPDGKNLIAETAIGPVHYLYHAPLKLSPAQLNAVKTLPLPDPAVAPPTPPAPTTPSKHKLPTLQASTPGKDAPFLNSAPRTT